jgi:K+-transporting ATPase ATPase C chain
VSGNGTGHADNTLHHLVTAVLVSLVSIVLLGVVYPLGMTILANLLFPSQANGSYVTSAGKVVGSAIIGQLFTKPQYFHGRPSAAGKDGYDPTSTGATNLGPTSAKLIANVAAAVKALRKENPDASGAIPPDLVTSSASGIDPDISVVGAFYQAPRIAKARGITITEVESLIRAHVHPRDLGFLGEPRINVLEINRALDAVVVGDVSR